MGLTRYGPVGGLTYARVPRWRPSPGAHALPARETQRAGRLRPGWHDFRMPLAAGPLRWARRRPRALPDGWCCPAAHAGHCPPVRLAVDGSFPNRRRRVAFAGGPGERPAVAERLMAKRGWRRTWWRPRHAWAFVGEPGHEAPRVELEPPLRAPPRGLSDSAMLAHPSATDRRRRVRNQGGEDVPERSADAMHASSRGTGCSQDAPARHGDQGFTGRKPVASLGIRLRRP